nr:hypothetical protein CFP56_00360 [Quercus suber]
MDMITVLPVQGNRYGRKILKEGQHLVVGSVVWNKEAQIGIATSTGEHWYLADHDRDHLQNSSNTDQSSTPTRHDADVLPSVLAFFTLTVMGVVEVRNSRPQRLDTSSRAIFSSSHCHVDRLWTMETSFDICRRLILHSIPSDSDKFTIFDLWSTLPEVGPGLGVVKKAMFVGSLGGPDDTGRCTRRVQPSMRLVAFVCRTEFLVGSRLLLYGA